MRRLRAFFIRIFGLLARRRMDDGFAAELESHIAMNMEDGIRAGLSTEEARQLALIQIGGAEQVRQRHRERRTLPWVENLAQDVRYGLRGLRRSIGFTMAAVLTLALGIGACTAIFSLVYAVLLNSLPYGDPSRLVYIYTPNPMFHVPAEVFSPSNADFSDIERQSRSYSGMSMIGQSVFNVASQGRVERVSAARVDANFFSVLEANPEVGRAINAGDEELGHEHVVVISHSLWESMFADSPDVLRDFLLLNGVTYRIVGVMPPEFGYPHKDDFLYGNSQVTTTAIWIPLALTLPQKMRREGSDSDAVIARLQVGVSREQAQSELAGIMARLNRLHSPGNRGWGALVESFTGEMFGPVRSLMRLLLGAVFLVLLISCANTAGLMLARTSDRLHEMGVRAALGATRNRIVRQLLTESFLIGLTAGSVGAALAYFFLRLLPLLNPGNIPRLDQASLDGRMLIFTVAVSVFTSIMSGILPALAVSRTSPMDFLATNGSRGASERRHRLQRALIVAEAAMVVVLMTGAGLLIRSYLNVESVDTGFSAATITMNVWLNDHPDLPLPQRARQRIAFFHELIGHLRTLPGISHAGAVNSLPLSGSESVSTFSVDGFPNRNGQLTEDRSITPGYFRAMGIPLLAGRYFSDADISSSDHVAVINQRFARIYFANRNPLGGRIDLAGSHLEVVGVVGDVLHSGLEEDPEPQIYHPTYELRTAFIAVRSALPSRTVVSEVRAVIKTIDPELAVANIRTMADLESEASARRRFQTTLLTLFASIALLLAIAGMYALMSYSVSRREREVGIRMALGARRIDVLMLVLNDAGALLGMGLIIGFGCAWLAAHVVRAFLFEVGDHDPATLLSVCILLAASGLTAAFIPARRAASADPMQVLRSE